MFNYRVQRVHWGEIGAVPKRKQTIQHLYTQQYFLSNSASVIERGEWPAHASHGGEGRKSKPVKVIGWEGSGNGE